MSSTWDSQDGRALNSGQAEGPSTRAPHRPENRVGRSADHRTGGEHGSLRARSGAAVRGTGQNEAERHAEGIEIVILARLGEMARTG